MKILSLKIVRISYEELTFMENSEVYVPMLTLATDKPTYVQVYDLFNAYVNRYARKLNNLYNCKIDIIYNSPLNVQFMTNGEQIDRTLIRFELHFPTTLYTLEKPYSNTAVTFRLETLLLP
jgi:hypothetical protein